MMDYYELFAWSNSYLGWGTFILRQMYSRNEEADLWVEKSKAHMQKKERRKESLW